jgi:hypothetical protein
MVYRTVEEWCRAELDAIKLQGSRSPLLEQLSDLLSTLLDWDPHPESLPDILVARACSSDWQIAQPSAILLHTWLNSAVSRSRLQGEIECYSA